MLVSHRLDQVTKHVKPELKDKLRIWKVTTLHQHQQMRYKDLVQADIVVVSVQFFIVSLLASSFFGLDSKIIIICCIFQNPNYSKLGVRVSGSSGRASDMQIAWDALQKKGNPLLCRRPAV